MPRNLDSTLLAAATSNQIAPVLLFEFDFSGGTVRTWTGMGNLIWNSNTYLGTGILLKVGTMGETQDIAATQFEFTLEGVNSTMLSLVMTEQYQGRGARMYLGAVVPTPTGASYLLMEDSVSHILLENGGKIVLEGSSNAMTNMVYASQIFGGTMDTIKWDDTGSTATITLSTQNAFYQLLIPRNLRLTDQSHRTLYPSDNGLKFVATIQDQQVDWGN